MERMIEGDEAVRNLGFIHHHALRATFRREESLLLVWKTGFCETRGSITSASHNFILLPLRPNTHFHSTQKKYSLVHYHIIFTRYSPFCTNICENLFSPTNSIMTENSTSNAPIPSPSLRRNKQSGKCPPGDSPRKKVHFHDEIEIEGERIEMDKRGKVGAHKRARRGGMRKDRSTSLPQSDNNDKTVTTNAPTTIPSKWTNILLLTLLYTLQGVPLGLTFGSIPYLIQQSLLSHATASSNTAVGMSPPEYSKTLGIFSFAAYPYAIKILWAPLIDGFFIRSVGRRKSWVLPVQLVASMLMFYVGMHIQEWIETLQVWRLTVCFTIMVLFCSMQDVAVDGWGLKLARDSAALCQSVGISTGYFLSYTIFLILSSPELRNWVLGVQERTSFVSLQGYLTFWSVIYLLLTAFIAIAVQEQSDPEEEELMDHECNQSAWGVVRQVYKYTFDILFRIRNMHWFIGLWMTARLATSVADTLTPIKMIEKGMRKDSIALVASMLAPLEYVWVWIGSKLQKRFGSLNMWSVMLLTRVCVGFLGTVFVWMLPLDMSGISPSFSWQFISFVLVSMVYSSCTNIMFVNQAFFFNEIAEERMGGTFSTLLNTFANLAGTLPKYVVFLLSDALSKTECTDGAEVGAATQCRLAYDGYYLLSFCALVYGIVWFVLMRNKLLELERAPISAWRLASSTAAKKEA
mmetsp:Transcript_1154/g.3973  ORF Transcript_1154/g.3973 Transcript_1154/m.3973 type:complete len:690 (+) Transcript_1154:1372-3441(+)